MMEAQSLIAETLASAGPEGLRALIVELAGRYADAVHGPRAFAPGPGAVPVSARWWRDPRRVRWSTRASICG